MPYPFCDRKLAARCGAMPKRRGFDNPKVASRAAKKMWAEGKARPGFVTTRKHCEIMVAIGLGEFPPKPNRQWKW